MTDIRGHGANIARACDDACAGCARLLVLDFPDDLVGELHEPFDAVVAMLDGKDEFLRGRAVEALLHDRADRWIPRHIGTREIGEEIEGTYLAFEPRFHI